MFSTRVLSLSLLPFLNMVLVGQNTPTQVQNQAEDLESIYNYPGSFKQMINADKTTISSGDSIKISHYISGNGYIDFNTAKLTQTVSYKYFYDPKKSYVFHNLTASDLIDSKSGIKIKCITFGAAKSNLILDGVNAIAFRTKVNFIGNSSQKLTSINMFTRIKKMDEDSSIEGLIFSEGKTYGSLKGYKETFIAPVEWHIKSNDSLKAGDYYFTFNFSYFNGLEWNTTIEKLEIHVMPWHEEYAGWLQFLAVIIGFATLFPIVKHHKPWFKKLYKKIILTKSNIAKRFHKNFIT